MATGGCWVDLGNDVWFSSDDVIPRPEERPSIGGLVFDPGPTTTVFLDLGDARRPHLYARDDEDEPAGVELFLQVVRPGRTELADLGEVRLDWLLDSSEHEIDPDDFLGLRISGTPTVSSDGAPWRLAIRSRVPAAFGGVDVVVDETVPDDGLVVDVGGQNLFYAGVVPIEGASIAYEGNGTWSISSALAPSIDALFTMASGEVVSGVLATDGLSVLGMALPDTVLNFVTLTGRWVAADLAADGAPVAVFGETVGTTVATGSRLATTAVEFALAAAPDGLVLDRVVGGWEISGSVERSGETVALSSPELFRFSNGIADAGSILMEGSYGGFAVIEDLVLSVSDEVIDDIDKTAAVFTLAGDVVADGVSTTLDGTLALVDGAVGHIEAPITLTLGKLGAIEGALRRNVAGAIEFVGLVPGEKPTYSCSDAAGGRSIALDEITGLSAGVPSEPLALPEVCFGPVVLRDVTVEPSTRPGAAAGEHVVSATLGGQPVSGSWEIGAGDLTKGTLRLPTTTIGGWLPLPAMRLDIVDSPDVDRFVLADLPGPDDLLRAIEIGFADGEIAVGSIDLGDIGAAVEGLVADAGDWLPIGRLEIDYDLLRETWTLNGRLTRPDVAFDAAVVISDGDFVSGSIDMNVVDLGPFAELDLRLDVTGDTTFAVVGSLQGPGFAADRTVSGSLTFAGGSLAAGTLEIDELPIGDLFVIEDLDIVFETRGTWSVSGDLRGEAADAVSVEGSLTFDDGEVVAGRIAAADLPLGPLTLDEFEMELDTRRDNWFAISGSVRGPADTSSGAPVADRVEFQGGAEWSDGDLTRFELVLPLVEIPGLAYLRDLEFEYIGGATGRLFATGTAVTADETAASAATFSMVVDRGEVLSAQIEAERIGLGGLLAIDLFRLRFQQGSPVACDGEIDGGAIVMSLSGKTPDGSTIAGCAAFAGRRLVGGRLEIERVRVGELIVVDDVEADFVSVSEYPAEWATGDSPPPELSVTRLSLRAVVAVGDLDEVTVTGAMELTDGGLSLFELAIPRIALSSTVELRDLSMTYAQPSRWDGVSDTTFALTGTAVHDAGETVAGGEFVFSSTGRLERARLVAEDLPLGPVTLRSFELVYERGDDATAWSIEGEVETPGGAVSALRGSAVVQAGRLRAASLVIPQLSIGELVMLSGVELTFERGPDGSERWFGTASVTGLGQIADPSTATFDITINAAGRLTSGLIEVSRVRWGGVFTVSDLVVTGNRVDATRFVWTLGATLSVGNGGESEVVGDLELVDGTVRAGSLSLTDVRLAELLVVDLSLLKNTTAGSAVWRAELAVTQLDGSAVTSGVGEMAWSDGLLEMAALRLGTIPVGELFTLEDLSLEFETGRRWSLSASITDDDGSASASGVLNFVDGAVSNGSLVLNGLQVGPLELTPLTLTVDATGVATSSVCGVADPGGPGLRFGVAAVVRTDDGDTTTLAGRLRLHNGTFVAGVVCADGLQLADMVLLDDVVLGYSQTGVGAAREVTFQGGAILRDPNEPSQSTSASLEFDLRNGQLQRLDLTAAGLDLGNLISLEDVELRFDRADDATNWEFGGTLERSGASSTRLEGELVIVDGVIVGGSLAAANLPVGDLFTFVGLELAFFDRRSVPDAGQSTAGVSLGNTTDCAAVPADSNLPGGVPPADSSGTGARFVVSANIVSNSETFAVRGSLDFAQGKLTQFDVSVACVPIGDFKRIQGLRIAYRGDHFIARGRMQDPDGSTLVAADFVFDAGRLTGGYILLNDVPLGAVKVDEFELALGENAVGDTTFGLSLSVERRNGSTVGGGGSLTLREGRIMAGSISIDELPFMDLFTLEDFEITFDNTVAGAARFVGEARVVVGDGPSVELDVSLVHEDGRLVGGSFAMEAIELFDAVPLAGFSIAYDGSLSPPQWSGSFQLGFAGNDSGSGPGVPLPSIQAGVEFRGGRLISGLIGFDGNGDGVVDGGGEGEAPTTGGGGGFSGLPLRGLYLKFCSEDAVAAYCENLLDGNVWEGRLSFQLPTESSPGLDAFLRIVDGRLSEASFEISGLNIPIYAGVFLQSIRGNIAVYPRFAMGGGLGITIGPSVATIVAIDGFMEVSEQPDPAPGSDPEDYEAEWIRFYTEGNANFFNLPIGLTAYGQIDTNGSVAFGGGIRLDIVDNVLYVNGESGGALFNAEALGLTNPRTGQPLTGVAAQLYAIAEARVLGQEVASTNFYANTIGAAGCAKVDFIPIFDPPWGDAKVGAGIYWSDGQTVLTCDMGKFAIVGIDIGPVAQSRAGSADAVSARSVGAAREAAFSTFTVAPGEPVLGVHVSGVGGAPTVSLIAPDGSVHDGDDSDASDGSLVATSPDARWFMIGNPLPGTWRVQATESSRELGEVTISHLLPQAEVSATLRRVGSDITVDWTATAIPGQQIAFLERSLEGGDGVTAGVGSASGGTGSFTFTPSGPMGGEVRELLAVVTQDGMTRDEIVLGTFQAPAAHLATVPRSVVATEVPGGARVTWSPPADPGGRPITAYRLSSTAGWTLTTDADVFSATLPIPAMFPGKSIPVWVQAKTGAGWGDAATAVFSSTQRTSLQATPNVRVESPPTPLPTDTTAPTVTVEQGVQQSDATSSPSIVFDVVFSEVVTGFDPQDVVIGGTAGAGDVEVIGSGGLYRVVVSGMDRNGTVIARVRPGAAFDAAGNPSLGSTSVDNVVTYAVADRPLAIDTPADLIVPTGVGRPDAVVEFGLPTATGGVAPAAVVCDPASGTTFRLGSIPVLCTATDAVGTQATTSFSVTVVDAEAPTIGSIGNITRLSADGRPVQVSFAPPSATDNSGEAPVVNCTPPSGSTFAVGATGVRCTATDRAGNVSSTTFTVTVTALGSSLPITGSDVMALLVIATLLLGVGTVLLSRFRRRGVE
jgi:hypothetical protein